MGKKVVIIGGGMAGLSAGTYLRMNGYDTEIVELNDTPGGVCTSWRRNDFTVDLCIHWLAGAGPSSSFYERWNELINMEEIQILRPEEYGRVEDTRGNQLVLYTDVDRLEAELLEKAPEDRRGIQEFVNAIRKLSHLDLPSEKAAELTNLWERIRNIAQMAPYLGVLGKFLRVSNKQYASEFSNPLLQKAIFNLFEPDTSVLFSLMMLAWLSNGSAGYPVGGSLNFALKLFDRYRQLGGAIRFNSRVTRILVKDHQATGIELENGKQIRADYVISAADGHATIFEMLGGHYLNERIRKFYDQHRTFPSLLHVALGIGRPLDDLPPSILFPMGKTIVIDPETIIDEIYLRTLNFDPTLAPEGKTLQTIAIDTYNYAYWQNLFQHDPDKYQQEKKRIADELVSELDIRFGRIKDYVEMIDIATPATFIRLTNNWKGSFEGWQMTPANSFEQLPHQLPGLERFFMCGQWVTVGGGVPAVVLSGREVAQLVCHQDQQPFRIVPPDAAGTSGTE